MEYAFAFGLVMVLFLCLYLGFREGLRIGMKASKGVEPKPIPNPITAFKQRKENKAIDEQMRKDAEAWQAFEENDGYTPEERKLVNRTVE